MRLLFEKDVVQNQQLDVLRQAVSKGFEQLAAGEYSSSSVMDIFEQANNNANTKL